MKNGLVARLVNDKFAPVIPRDALQVQQAILSVLHSLALGGHLGQRIMHVLVKKWFHWPSITKDFKQFCSECNVC